LPGGEAVAGFGGWDDVEQGWVVEYGGVVPDEGYDADVVVAVEYLGHSVCCNGVLYGGWGIGRVSVFGADTGVA
jgi:hypothetical protein